MPRPQAVLTRGPGALVLFLLQAAAAGGEGFSSPAANSPLVAGSEVIVHWSGATPREQPVSEMELLLSIDGGQTFGVRVTAEIHPDSRSVAWRVPSLPSAHARLALRVGSGDEDSEAIALVSEEFSIEVQPGDPPEDFFRLGAEWRTRDALTLGDSELPAPRSMTSEPRIAHGSDPDLPMTPPPTEPLVEAPPPSREPVPSGPLVRCAASAIVNPARRVLLPLRE